MKTFWKIIILILIVGGIWYWWRLDHYQKDLAARVSETDASDVLFEVESGQSALTVAANLENADLTVSANSMMNYLDRENMASQVKAGRYILQKTLTIPEIAAKLTSDEVAQIKVRIPEGFTIAQTDEYLAAKNIIAPGELVRCADECDFSGLDLSFEIANPDAKQRLEGLIFPDTYFHDSRDVDAEAIIGRALIEMERNLQKVDLGGRDPNEVMTMASLIEEETLTAAEKPIVSGILWGRLADGMRLDVDATTRYAVDKKLAESLTKEDLQSDSPYNTRKKHGLPPGSIGTFSFAALEAAAEPTDTDYRYYLHDGDGVIHYARTLAGHNQNVADYLH